MNLKPYPGYYHCRRLVLALSITFSLSGCYTYRVSSQAGPGSETTGRTVHSFFWGLVQSPKKITTPTCDSLNSNGMAEVTVKNNLGYSLITVVSLGIWSPTRIEWKCSKPCQKVGAL